MAIPLAPLKFLDSIFEVDEPENLTIHTQKFLSFNHVNQISAKISQNFTNFTSV